jgi:PAS domain S-box-containing protein
MADVKIILVEDNSDETLDIKKTLESFGYDVPYVVFNGEETIEKVKEYIPDLILMNIVLDKKDIDNNETISRIRELEVPILYLTKHSEDITMKKAHIPDSYLLKPFDETELKFSIELAKLKNDMKKELNEKERNLQLITDNMIEMVGLIDIEGVFQFLSPSTKRIIGYDPTNILGKSFLNFIHEKDVKKVKENLKKVFNTSSPLRFTFRVKHLDGHYIWLETINNPISNVQSKGIVFSAHDITDQKNTEDILHVQHDLTLSLSRESDLNPILKICLDAAIKVSGMDSGGLYLLDDKTGNLNLMVHTGLSSEFVDSASKFVVNSPSAVIVLKGKPVYTQYPDLPINLPKSRSQENLMSIAIVPILFKNRVIACLNVASHHYELVPIQSRKGLETIASLIGGAIIRAKGERALRKSEREYKAIFENTGAASVILNDQGLIINANHEMEILSGYNLEEVENKMNWIEFIPQKELEMMLTYQEARKKDSNSTPSRYESRLIKKDGDIKNIMLTVDFIPGTNNRVASILDISDLRVAENDLRKSLEEKDVLIREIHHRVKNNMQIISSLLNLQTQHVEGKEAINELMDRQGRIKSMAMIHEKIYQSSSFTKINFNTYVEKLVQEILNTYGVKETIQTQLNIHDINLNIETAIPLGLIINELVTNSIKYAFPQDKGTLTLQLKSINDKMELIIADDGIGLPEDIDYENTKTLGLQLVNTLTQQIDSEITLDRSNGTKFKIIFNELKYKERMKL